MDSLWQALITKSKESLPQHEQKLKSVILSSNMKANPNNPKKSNIKSSQSSLSRTSSTASSNNCCK